MAKLDILTYGFGFISDQGSFGFSSISLITQGSRKILVDTGPASRRQLLYKALQSKNLCPEDIDTVILTHLHWDHCQNTDLFTNARILLHPKELDYARNPAAGDINAAWYIAEMMDKLKAEPVSEGDTVTDGISIIDTPGHTKGHISVVVEIDKETAIVAGDALPDTGTITRGVPYNVFWDIDDATNSVEKMLDKASIFYPGHDRPFRVEGQNTTHLHGPSQIEIVDSNEGGHATALAYRVAPQRLINHDPVQKK